MPRAVGPAELFRAVYEHPSDDGARQVLADVLIEAGDPRGEFIALQMASRRTRKAELKLERLLERHREQFLGPLARVVTSRGQVWEKGFLTACRATLDGSLFDEPSWATVRALEVLNRDDEVPRELLSPHLRALKEVSGLPRQGVLLVFAADRSLPFTSVAVEGPGNAEAWSVAELDALRTARALPDLRHLALNIWRFDVDELEWAWTAPVFGRVRTLELRFHRLAANLGALRDRLLTLTDVPDALVLKGRQLEAKLKPDDDWRVMHLTFRTPIVDPVIHDVELMLQSLPTTGLLRLDVTCSYPTTNEALARLKAMVKRFPRLARVSWPAAGR
jgi:uncharacterized protein (TIGR02996 family)